MASTGKIVFEIHGKDVSGTKVLRDFATAAQQAGAITTAQAKQIIKAYDDIDRKAQGLNRAKVSDAARRSGIQGLDRLVPGGAAGNFVGNLGGTETLLGAIGTKAAVATAVVATLGVAAAKAGQVSVRAFADLADQVQQFSNLTNTTVEESSGWVLSLNALGLSTEQWVDRVRQFQTNMAQFPERIRDAGIEVERFADGTVDAAETMLNALQVLHDMPDVLERQRMGFQLFGESWTQLMPIIRDPEAFRAMRDHFEGTFDQAKIDTLNRFKISTGLLQQEFSVLAAEVGAKIVPALIVMADIAGDVIDKVSDLADKAGGFVDGWLGAVELGLNAVPFAGHVLSRATGEARDKLREAASAAGALSGAIDGAAGSAARLAAALGRTAEETQRMKSASADVKSISSSYAAAQKAAGEASLNRARVEADAAVSIAKANQSAASAIQTASDQVASAKASWADASAALGKAEQQAARMIADAEKAAAKSVTQAQKQVVDAREAATESIEEYQAAELEAQEVIADAAESAAEKIVDAQDRVADAREKAEKVQRDSARKLEDAEAARQRAERQALNEDNRIEATRILEESQRDYARTVEDVAEAQKNAADGVKDAEQGLRDAVVDAEEQRAEAAERAAEIVTRAKERVTDANERVREAEENLAETSVEAAQRVADAHASASESITNAQSRVAQAAAGVADAEANLAAVTAQAENDRARAHEDAARRIADAKQAEMEAAARAFNFEQQLQAARWQQYYAQLALFKATWAAQDPGNPLTRVTSNVPGVARPVGPRARGGPVMAGGTYLVGEDGPELLHMGAANGYVQAGAGGGVTVNVYGGVYSSRQQLADMIREAARDGLVGVRG